MFPIEYILYRSSAVPLPQNKEPRWTWKGPLTSQTIQMSFAELKAVGASVMYATWRAVWQANAPGDQQNGVALFFNPPLVGGAAGDLSRGRMLFYFALNDVGKLNMPTKPDGTAIVGCGCEVPADRPAAGAHPCNADLTQVFNELIQEGVDGWFATGTWGNGVSGPDLYESSLQVWWNAPAGSATS